MTETKKPSRLARIGSRAQSLDKAAIPLETHVRSRHSAITNRVDTYQHYKEWIRSIRDSIDETK